MGTLATLGVGGGATLLIQDTFTAVNGTTLPGHAPDVNTPGNAWVVQSGAGNIQNNKAQCSTGVWVATIDSGQANVTVTADIVLSVAGSDDGPVVRFQDANNYWFADASGSNNFILYEKTGGSFVQRASTTVTVSTGTTYTVQVQASGTTITATINGGNPISYGSATDFQTATKHGIKLDNATDTADNFKVTTP
jgi:pectate lyase